MAFSLEAADVSDRILLIAVACVAVTQSAVLFGPPDDVQSTDGSGLGS